MIRWIDALLHNWGRWTISAESRGIGYPQCSPMFRDSPSSDVFESKIPLGIGMSDYKDVSIAVEKLPHFQRAVVVLVYVQRLTKREAGQQCGVKHDTVTKYLDAAHEALARELNTETA